MSPLIGSESVFPRSHLHIGGTTGPVRLNREGAQGARRAMIPIAGFVSFPRVTSPVAGDCECSRERRLRLRGKYTSDSVKNCFLRFKTCFIKGMAAMAIVI